MSDVRVYTARVCPFCDALVELNHRSMLFECPEHGSVEDTLKMVGMVPVEQHRAALEQVDAGSFDYELIVAHVEGLPPEQLQALARGPSDAPPRRCGVCRALRHPQHPAERLSESAFWLVNWHDGRADRASVLYALAHLRTKNDGEWIQILARARRRFEAAEQALQRTFDWLRSGWAVEVILNGLRSETATREEAEHVRDALLTALPSREAERPCPECVNGVRVEQEGGRERREPCPNCNGRGAVPVDGFGETCSACHGTGVEAEADGS